MRLSLSFPGIVPIASTLPVVQAAERCGLDGVWSAEHIGCRDTIVPSAVYLRESARLEVGVCGLSIAARHPGVIATGALESAPQAAGPQGIFDALTPDVIDAIAVVATPDRLPDVLRRYAQSGIDELALSLIAAPKDQPRLVELLARARP